MGLSQASIFLLAFLTIAVLVLLIKKNRPVEQDVVVYSLGFKEFEETGNDEEHKISGVLHVSQIVKKAAPGGNLTVVNVDFPMNVSNKQTKGDVVEKYFAFISGSRLCYHVHSSAELQFSSAEGAAGLGRQGR